MPSPSPFYISGRNSLGRAVLLLPAFALYASIFLAVSAKADTESVPPKGEYGTVDTRPAIELIKQLGTDNRRQKKSLIKKIVGSPENHSPPVLYAMSNALFDIGKPREGAFWFHAAQLRANYDARRCTDQTARSAIGLLDNMYGPRVGKYVKKDLQQLKSQIKEVVEWDEATPHNYDHRWINLHGMDAITSSLKNDASAAALSLPADQWPTIAKETRTDYLKSYFVLIERLQADRQK